MPITPRIVGVAVIAVAMCRTPLAAQTGAGIITPEQEKAFETMAAPAILPLGTLAGAGLGDGLTALELILEGTQEEGVGTASIGWKRGSGQYRFKFSSPVNKSTKEAVPFDFTDGVPTGATFELTASNLLWAQPSDADVEELRKICVAELQRSCQIGELPIGARAEARRLLRMDDKPKYIGVSVTVAQKEFDYLDAGLKEQSEAHANVAGTFRIGAFSESFGFGFFSWSYQQQFKAGGPEQQICLPLEGTVATLCNPAVLGAPSSSTSSIVGAELRRFFGDAIGIAPSFKWETRTDVTSLSLPVYFLRNKEGGLTGGVRANWRSDTDSISLSVFIGTSLTMTP